MVPVSLSYSDAAGFLLVVVVELGYSYTCAYLLVEEDFFLAQVKQTLASQLANGLATLVYSFIAPDFFNTIYSNRDFANAKPHEFAGYILATFLSLVVLKPVFERLTPYRERLRPVYIGIFFLQWITYIHEFITKIIVDDKDITTMIRHHNDFYFLSCGAIVSLLVVLWVTQKNKLLSHEELERKQKTEQLLLQYENIIAADQKMREIRHEFNRQMDLIRAAKGYISREELVRYLGELDERSRERLSLSRSGSLYLDTAIEQNYAALKEYGITNEVVLAPLKVSEEVTNALINVINEYYAYIIAKHRYYDWFRITVRSHKKNIICLGEAGFKKPNGIHLRRTLSRIMGSMLLYEDFPKSFSVAKNMGGAFEKEITDEELRLITMIACN